MNVDRLWAVPPPPTRRAAGRGLAAVLLAPFGVVVGTVLANIADAPIARVFGIAVVLAFLGPSLVVMSRRQMRQVSLALAGAEKGPYVLVPTTLAWRQLGYASVRSRSPQAVRAFVTGDLLELVVQDMDPIAPTLVRAQLIAIRPRRVLIAGDPWWGIAIQRIDKPDDLEFGINDDQADVAVAEQRAIAVAAQLTSALRLADAPASSTPPAP